MADNDDIIQTVTFEVKPGNSVQEASDLGKQLGNALGRSFNPNLAIRPDTAAKQAEDSAKVFSEFYSKSLARDLQSSLQKHLDFSRQGPLIPPPSRPSVDRPESRERINIAEAVQPFLSGIEAMSLVLRGAPLTTIAQMMGQTARDFGALRGAAQLVGGRACETREAAIARRLEESGATPEAAREAAGKPLAERFGKGSFIVTEAIGGIAAIGGAVHETRKLIREAGEEGAETNIQWNDMAKTMGLTEKQFVEMNLRLHKSGLNTEDLNRSFVRLGLTVKREMPEIEKEVARTSDTTTESNLKVADATRKVTSSGLEQQAAVEGVTKAQGELVKVQETGAATREQQAQAARLAVSKAGLGAEQAVVQGPLTVAGARLGLKGAQLSAEDARARLAEITSGQKEDPETVKARQIMQAQHAVEVAELNERQARLRVRQAKPEADLAREEAELHEQQAQTNERRLQIDQQYNPLQDQQNAATRGVTAASLRAAATTDEGTKAAIDLRDAQRDHATQQYTQTQTVQQELQKIARGEKPSEGFKIEEALGHPETLRRAIFRQGGYEIGGLDAGGALGFTQDLLRGMAAGGYDESQRASVLSGILPGRGLIGSRLQKARRAFEKPTEELTSEDKRLRDETVNALTMQREEAEETAGIIGGARGRKQLQQFLTGQVAMAPARRAAGKLEEDDAAVEVSKRGLLRSVEAGDKLVDFMSGQGSKIDAGGDSIHEHMVNQGPKIDEGGSAVEQSLKDVAGKIGGGAKSSSESPSSSAGEVTGEEKARGGLTGLLHGAGTGTSDSIPINASAGEYVIKASSVNALGVPFLDSLNAGNFADGGPVDESYTQYIKRKEAEKRRREREDEFERRRATGYTSPKPYDPMHPGTEKEEPSFTGPGVKPVGIPVRAPFGGYNNALQQRLAMQARQPDFDPKNVQAYLSRLQSGETPESIKATDTALKARTFDLPAQFPGAMVERSMELPHAAEPSPEALGRQFDAVRASKQEFLEREGLMPENLTQQFEAVRASKQEFLERQDKKSDEGNYQEGGPVGLTEDKINKLKSFLDIPPFETGKLEDPDAGKEMSTEQKMFAAKSMAGWGAWAARTGLPMLDIAIPAAVGAGLDIINPAMYAAAVGWQSYKGAKEIYDTAQARNPMTLGDQAMRERGGLSIDEAQRAKIREMFASDGENKQGGGLIGMQGGGVDMGAVNAMQRMFFGGGGGGTQGGGFGGGALGGSNSISTFLSLAMNRPARKKDIIYRFPAPLTNPFSPQEAGAPTTSAFTNAPAPQQVAEGGLIKGYQGGGSLSPDASAFSGYHGGIDPTEAQKLLMKSLMGDQRKKPIIYRFPAPLVNPFSPQEEGAPTTSAFTNAAKGGLIKGMAEGGLADLFRGAAPAGPVPVSDEGAYGQMSQKAANAISYMLSSGGGFGDAVANASSFYSGGEQTQGAVKGVAAALSYHQLDLRTPNGTFSASVDEDTLQAIQNSALGSKLTQIGQRPSWFS